MAAVLQVREGATIPTQQEIEEHLSTRIARYKVPRFVHTVDLDAALAERQARLRLGRQGLGTRPPPPVPDWFTTVSALVRARVDDPRPGLRFEGRTWSWAEHTAEAAARAAWYADSRRSRQANGPPHIGVLLENVPEYSFWLAAAALGRFVLVGLNATRRGEQLAEDITGTACDLVLTDRPELLEGLNLGGAVVRDPHIAYAPADLPADEAQTDDLYLLIFTSGTTGAPKAVRCSQGKIAT